MDMSQLPIFGSLPSLALGGGGGGFDSSHKSLITRGCFTSRLTSKCSREGSRRPRFAGSCLRRAHEPASFPWAAAAALEGAGRGGEVDKVLVISA